MEKSCKEGKMINLERKHKVEIKKAPELGTMIEIPGGKFMMGSEDFEESESPVHSVKIDSFLLCAHPLTQLEWSSLTGKNPSQNPGERFPVENVSWYAAIAYCNKLSISSGLEAVYSISGSANPEDWGKIPRVQDSSWDSVEMKKDADGYRLPTEAEWEYAAMGGENGKGISETMPLYECAWYAENSGGATHEVMKKSPGPFGLYDMLGNVWEWCWDWFSEYPVASQENPLGPKFGSGHVRRGGGWNNAASYCREKSRGHSEYGKYPFLGLRLARSLV